MNNRLLVPRKTPGLLDLVPGAAAAYSLRSLSNSYADPVVTVRRSSDNAEDSFTASEVADGTLAAFCGAGDGFVKQWWDQSGNARHASQSTTTTQPKIVDAGAVITEGGSHAIRFASSNSTEPGVRLQTLAFTVSQPATVFIVASSTSDDRQVLFDGRTSETGALISTDTVYRLFAGTSLPYGSIKTGQVLHSLLYSGVGSLAYLDGALSASGDIGTTAFDGLTIGNLRGVPSTIANAYEWVGTIQELILYPSDLTAQREVVEGLIAWGYSV